MPIAGLHALIYSDHPVELRAFFRDKLRLPFTDVGDNWLIFDAPAGDLGVHPTDPAGHSAPHNTHQVSFFTTDIHATVAELQSRGVQFTHPVEDHGYGLVTHLKAPGNLTLQLYQPHYKKNPTTAPRALNPEP